MASDSKTVRWLVRQQDSDGGFSFSGAGGSSDVDDTGATLEALAGDHAAARCDVAGGGLPAPPAGPRRRLSRPSPAWAPTPSRRRGRSRDSTRPGCLRRRCTAAGRSRRWPTSTRWWRANGAVRYSRGVTQTPVWVTGEALMAMEGKPLPIAAPAPPPVPAQPATSTHARPRPVAAQSAPSVGLAARGDAPSVRLRTQRPTGTGHRPRPSRPLAPIARNQVLAGNFAHAVGVITALALAPVGLG